ncbi:hypothetical protein D0Y65_040203 [Glycine soja]|uniref:Uncharacterized protein n=1 Tax=Glycine soja TaxID=3848 RepID=A0A445GQI7_GLYSO|nr:hypothetical protein D0Y65_040203 [Glycine soja]
MFSPLAENGCYLDKTSRNHSQVCQHHHHFFTLVSEGVRSMTFKPQWWRMGSHMRWWIKVGSHAMVVDEVGELRNLRGRGRERGVRIW